MFQAKIFVFLQRGIFYQQFLKFHLHSTTVCCAVSQVYARLHILRVSQDWIYCTQFIGNEEWLPN